MEYKECITDYGFKLNDDIFPHLLYDERSITTTPFYIVNNEFYIVLTIYNRSYKLKDIINNYSREDLLLFVLDNLKNKSKRYIYNIEGYKGNCFVGYNWEAEEISKEETIKVLEDMLFNLNPAKSILKRIQQS